MKKIALNNMTLRELENVVLQLQEKKYRAQQIFTAINKQYVSKIDDISNIPSSLKVRLNQLFDIKNLKIHRKIESNIDKTKKYLLELEDGNIVESVYMNYKTHSTICISTQVGCRMGCVFCASTKETYVRNLDPYEIAQQIYIVSQDVGERISNVVLMGIGEPLDNYDNVISFIRLITYIKGYNISARGITISTCGIVPRIYDLAKENIPINLTISLHSPFDRERQDIMPIARKYSIEEIIKACDNYFYTTGRRVSYEYTLIKDKNDGPRYAKGLSQLLKNKNCHINLIPLNPIDEYSGESTGVEYIIKFKKILEQNHIVTTVRKKQGADIEGACGQLRLNHIKNVERS